MTFTDDDLKLLKEVLTHGGDTYEIEADEMLDLIARLEAAERTMFSLQIMVRAMREQGAPLKASELIWLEGAETAIEAWRKTKGDGE